MSFILDALKKSETDRQQQGSAEFAGVPTSPQSSSVPRWLWVVGLLLAINLVVLIGLLFRPDAGPAQPVVPARASTNTQPTASEPPRSSFAEQVAAARENPPDRQTAVIETRNDTQENAREDTQETIMPVLISQDPEAVPAKNLYPTLQEVRARGTIRLPELHLDIHVFSPVPDDRFVFVNMTKLREGSTLSEGPVITEITPDGVVLRHEGQVFLLPRE